VTIRGIRWYAGALVALLAAAAALGVFARSFFSSFTPLYVSIVCSVLAVGCAVVAVLRSRRPGEAV
jgi:hypothetical protein